IRLSSGNTKPKCRASLYVPTTWVTECFSIDFTSPSSLPLCSPLEFCNSTSTVSPSIARLIFVGGIKTSSISLSSGCKNEKPFLFLLSVLCFNFDCFDFFDYFLFFFFFFFFLFYYFFFF